MDVIVPVIDKLSARSGIFDTAVPGGRPFHYDDFGCGQFLGENGLNNASPHEGRSRSPMPMESWAMRQSPSIGLCSVLHIVSPTVVASSSTPDTRHDIIPIRVQMHLPRLSWAGTTYLCCCKVNAAHLISTTTNHTFPLMVSSTTTKITKTMKFLYHIYIGTSSQTN